MKLSMVILLGIGCSSAAVVKHENHKQDRQTSAVSKRAVDRFPVGNVAESIYDGYIRLGEALRVADTRLGQTPDPDQPLSFGERVVRLLVPEAKLYNRTEMNNTETVRAGAIKAKAAFGPYKMVGKNDYRPVTELISLDPHGQGKISFLPRSSFCGNKDCTILSARIGLTYANGSEASPATGIYVHHLLSVVPARPSVNAVSACDLTDPATSMFTNLMPSRLPFSPFTGRGEDGGPVAMSFTSGDGAFNSGFHLGKNDLVFVQSDIVNYSTEKQDVYVTYEYEYVEGLQGAAAVTTLLSVTGCALIIPPALNLTGRAVTSSKRFPILADATIVNLRGHMHDGGELMSISLNNKTICESFPEYKDGQLWSMTSCGEPVEVKKGDYLTMSSIYDPTKHPLRAGVSAQHTHATNILGMNDLMGMWAVTFAGKVNATSTR